MEQESSRTGEPHKPPPLVVHTDWSRAWGGQEIRVLTELREMRRLGFRVALIVPFDAELARRGAAEGFPVHGVSAFAKLNPRSWLEVFRLIRRLRPTVLNTHSSEDSWMAGIIGRLCGVPLIVRTRHVLAPISSSFSYRFPQVILTCSQSIADQLATQGVPPVKMVVASTGNDEARFRYSPEHRREIRDRYGIGDNIVLVGNVSFLRHYKGHPFIIRTAASMPPSYRFMLVGDGGDLPALQALVGQLGVEDRVIFAGHQEHPEHFFSAFDLCFFSSFEAEGVSQSLIQGLLNGLPVLACRIPSTMEPLRLVEDCRLVEYDDVDGACRGLAELAALPRRDPARMALQHDLIAGHYGLRHMVDIVVEVYGRHGIHPPAEP